MIPRKIRHWNTYPVGTRVQLHPASNRWMRGDRYGVVVKNTLKLVHVLMDRSGQVAKLHPSNIGEIVS